MHLFSFLLMLPFTLFATSFSFYETDIDYWPEKAKVEEVQRTEEKKIVEEKSNKEEMNRFDWEKVSDPDNDEFYRQGDHMPPAALVEAMKNPSDQNLKRYFDLKEKRERKLQEFTQRSEKYRLKKLEKALSKMEKVQVNKNKFYNAREIRSKYKIRMYYDSNCPHCKRMYQNLITLQKDGFSVDAIQIDKGPNSFSKIKSRRLRDGEGKLVGLYQGGTPYTLILNSKTNKVSSLRGYVSLSKLTDILK